MVCVPAGDFSMGSTANDVRAVMDECSDCSEAWLANEQPQHVVYEDAFWVDRSEVTVAMFRTFVQATGYRTTAEQENWGEVWSNDLQNWDRTAGANWQHPRGPGSQAMDSYPVVQVSWADATAYCAWAGGELPTEAEWEKAARGTNKRKYPWGNSFDGRWANYCDSNCERDRWRDDTYKDGYRFTAPVESFPVNISPYGAFDMAGNVWEWVADWYDENYYSYAPSSNPGGPDTGESRVLRGGAWSTIARWLRCANRDWEPPSWRRDNAGFRCKVDSK
jgi:serine/threonine-protein kinase